MKYLIVGLGKSGTSALHLLLETGYPRKQILTFDDKNPDADLKNSQDLKNLPRETVIVLSPGYPLSTPWLQELLAKGHPLASEISLAVPHLRGEKIIAITGSVGKSTTAALLYQGALQVDQNAFLGANFGTPLAEYVRGVLQTGRRSKWLILELSSFQLENPGPLSVDFAVITSLIPNHLERYKSLEDYYQAKMNLMKLAKYSVILNEHGGDLKKFYPHSNSVVHWASPKNPNRHELKTSLIGNHNLENMAVAFCVADLAGWPESSFKAMSDFKGLRHRLENLGTQNGVLYVNDSKATAIDSVLSAVQSCLESVKGTNRVHLLLGGRDKNLPWEQLRTLQNQPLVQTYFFGECAALAQRKSGLYGPQFQYLLSCLRQATAAAKPGDCVLLSPGGTSLDEFKNFEERGDFFRSHVLSNSKK